MSVKTLAMGCLTNGVALSPKIFLLKLFVDDAENAESQETIEDDQQILIRDVANYTRHDDPQLRGSVVTLLGQVLSQRLCRVFMFTVQGVTNVLLQLSGLCITRSLE